MGFWLFMFLTNLLIPGIMIIAGYVFRKTAPGEINSIVGYRTMRSMKNQDTWQFAHAHFSRIWIRVGWWMLPIAVIPMFFLLGKSEEVIGAVCTVIELGFLAALFLSLIPTERALKRTFDENGNRIAAPEQK